MSCILFAKGSYEALERHPVLRAMREQSGFFPGPAPNESLADILFKTNCEAYRARYGKGALNEQEIANLADCHLIDTTFERHLERNTYSGLWLLMSAIEYQFAEGDNWELRPGAKIVAGLKEQLAEKMARLLQHQETPVFPPGGVALLSLLGGRQEAIECGAVITCEEDTTNA